MRKDNLIELKASGSVGAPREFEQGEDDIAGRPKERLKKEKMPQQGLNIKPNHDISVI